MNGTVSKKSSPAEEGCFCGNYTRFVIFILCIACLTLVMSNSIAINFTVICMFKDPVIDNGTSPANSSAILEPEPLFSASEKSWLFSATAIGQIFGTPVIPFLTTRFGVRNSFTGYGLLSAASTLLIPTLTPFGFIYVFLMRILQGFAFSISLPSLGAIGNEWASSKNTALAIAVLSLHIQFGIVFTMPVAGALCTSPLGWPAVYYLQGVLTLILFIAFYVFYRDSPTMHKNVSAKELRVLSFGKTSQIGSDGQRPPVPYKEIFQDLSIWGIFVSTFGGMFGFALMMQFGPTYLNKVLNYDVKSTGLAAALPYVLSIVFKLVSAPISDRLTIISEKKRVIMFNSLAQFPMSACFITMALLPVSYAWLIQIFFTFATAFCGLNAVGVSKSVNMVAQLHSHFILAVCMFLQSLVAFILPMIVAFLAPDNTKDQWTRILYLVTAMVIVSAIFFNFTAEAEPRPWALMPKPPSVADAANDPDLAMRKVSSPESEKSGGIKFTV